jgi:hypothetical protein
VRGVNTARDHRLRVRFDTGLAGARTLADAAFGPVERRPLVVPADEQRAERVLHTAPLHRYVSRYAPDAGATVYSDGLAEYEAADDGAVFVTLVRAVGELSRPDLPERPGHAGWPTATPEAQALGAFAARFAVAFHGGRLGGHARVRRAHGRRRAAAARRRHVAGAARPAARRGRAHPRRRGARLRCGRAVGRRRVGGAAVREPDGRCGRRSLDGGRAAREARRARLDETPGEALAAAAGDVGSVVAFTAGPREVVTVLVR